MREPLNQFADRIVRTGELPEFLRGLMLEKGITPSEIILIASRVQDEIAPAFLNGQNEITFLNGRDGPFRIDLDELW